MSVVNEGFKIIAYWMIYGFLGFIIETLYVSYFQKKFVQRGFLSGPIIPIYAFGAMLVIYILEPVSDNVLSVFIFGIIVTSTLEYIVSYAMEKIFNIRLWDYSSKLINVNGRICLLNSVLFGILSVFLIFVIHPNIIAMIDRVNINILYSVVSLLSVVTIIDTTFSTLATLDINVDLKTITEQRRLKTSSRLDKIFENSHKRYKHVKSRLFKAYPEMESLKLKDILDELKEHYKNMI